MESGAPSDGPKRDQLREEAGKWFARMRRADADKYREEFERWLARGAMHRCAYNRVAETFSLGKGLTGVDDSRSEPRVPPARERAWRRSAVLIGLLVIGLIGGWLLVATVQSPMRSKSPVVAERTSPPTAPRQLATVLGEIRTFRLSDGSSVTLDTDSLVTVSYTEGARHLRLERGRARFEVAHEARPFEVAAGSGLVTARGTVFDVSIGPDDKVVVRLLRGSVDVRMAVASPPGEESRTELERLVSGEQITFSDAPGPSEPSSQTDENWPNATIDFDEVRLADVVVEANRYSARRIRLGDSGLADLRVSGVFRITDTWTVAERLAINFGLTVDASDPAELVLRRP